VELKRREETLHPAWLSSTLMHFVSSRLGSLHRRCDHSAMEGWMDGSDPEKVSTFSRMTAPHLTAPHRTAPHRCLEHIRRLTLYQHYIATVHLPSTTPSSCAASASVSVSAYSRHITESSQCDATEQKAHKYRKPHRTAPPARFFTIRSVKADAGLLHD